LNAKQNHCGQAAKLRSCRPDALDPDTIAAAAAAVRSGEVICFPTGSLYGLGADAFDPEAVRRVFEIKHRSPDKPVLVLVNAIDQLEQLVVRVPSIGRDLMQRFWPGKLTLVFEARGSVPPILTAGTGKIGIRQPGHPVARALAAAVGRPLTGTSANVSGDPGCRHVSDLPASIRTSVSMVIDSGPLAGGAGSTVVDISGDRPIVLREGSVPAALIHEG
jgi:L-threonylcarbamoyladenylate synthase